MNKYDLTLTGEQLKVILEALDFTTRLKAGQMDELLQLRLTTRDIVSDMLLRNIKQCIFPELGATESFGIHTEKLSDSCRVAFDIYQVIRQRLSWDTQPITGDVATWGYISQDTPDKTSTREELPTIKKVESDDH